MKAFDPQWIAFRNFVKTGIQFAVCTTTPWFLWPLNSIWTEYPTILVGSSPSERNRVCVEALLVVWSDLSERAREFDSRLWKSLWVTLIAMSFVLVFEAQLSGAKFNAIQGQEGTRRGQSECVPSYILLCVNLVCAFAHSLPSFTLMLLRLIFQFTCIRHSDLEAACNRHGAHAVEAAWKAIKRRLAMQRASRRASNIFLFDLQVVWHRTCRVWPAWCQCRPWGARGL